MHRITVFLSLFIILLPFLFLSKIYFLTDPPIWPDEPVFFEMSQNLMKTGKLTSNIYGGGNNLVGETALGYPPLYFALQGIWTEVFGATIEVIRGLSLVLALGTLIVFYFLIKEFFKNKNYAYLGTFLLSLNIFFLRAARLGRMEILGLLLILLTIFSWLIFIRKKDFKYLFVAGILAGFSAITHPLGFMAPVIIGVYILINKPGIQIKLKSIFIFVLPVLFFISLWLLTSGNNPLAFLQTYQVHMQDKAPKVAYLFVLFNKNFTWWSLFISELLIFLLFLFTWLKDYSFQKLYLAIAIIITFLFAIFGKEGGYMLYFQPFIILALLFIFQSFSKYQFIIWQIFIILVSFFFISDSLKIQLLENDNLAINSSALIRDYNQYANSVLTGIPQNQKLKVFIAAVPDPYFVLIKNSNLSFIEAADPAFPILNEDYKNILDRCDYLFVTWFPHQYLSDYVDRNAEEKKLVGQNGGYTGVLIKLKPLQIRR